MNNLPKSGLSLFLTIIILFFNKSTGNQIVLFALADVIEYVCSR